MPRFVAVLPVVWRPYGVDCLATMHPALASRTLVVDNTEVNRGVPWSWNAGIDYMTSEGADWLVILSAAVRFGDAGGRDFIAELDAHRGPVGVEAHPHFGWHCIALAAEALGKVGRFDENFYPGYWEDNDWSHRARCVYDHDPTPPDYWPKVALDATDAGWGHAIDLAGVDVNPDALIHYYQRKWGGMSPDERWCHPFDDPSLPIDYQAPSLNGPGSPPAVRP